MTLEGPTDPVESGSTGPATVQPWRPSEVVLDAEAGPYGPGPGPKVYLAGPIDCVGENPEAWIGSYLWQRRTLMSELARLEREVFGPAPSSPAATRGRYLHLPPLSAAPPLPSGPSSPPPPSGVPAALRVWAAWEGTRPGEQSLLRRATQELALTECDLLVALLPAGIPSIGTPIEVWRAASAGTPVVVLSETRSEVLSDLGERYGLVQVSSVQRAIQACSDRLRSFAVAPVDADPPAVGALIAAAPAALAPTAPAVGALACLVEEGKEWALPTRHYADDAGLDLYVSEQITIGGRSWANVQSGIRLALPEGTFGLLMGRSSTYHKRGLQVQPAIIDVGWRGPMMVGVFNPSDHAATINPGDRLAQLVLLPNLTMQHRPVRVDELSSHPRGENGFGSTGMGKSVSAVAAASDPGAEHRPLTCWLFNDAFNGKVVHAVDCPHHPDPARSSAACIGLRTWPYDRPLPSWAT